MFSNRIAAASLVGLGHSYQHPVGHLQYLAPRPGVGGVQHQGAKKDEGFDGISERYAPVRHLGPVFVAQHVGLGHGFLAMAARRLPQQQGEEPATKEPHTDSAFFLYALVPGLLGHLILLQAPPDASERPPFRIFPAVSVSGRLGLLSKNYHIVAQETAMPSWGAVYPQVPIISPLAQGGLVDRQKSASVAQGKPGGLIGESLINHAKFCGNLQKFVCLVWF